MRKKRRRSTKCQRCHRRERRPNRTICDKCRSRLDRERHPARYAYENLKRSATKEGKPFAMPFPCFLTIAHVGLYVARRGNAADGWTMDRTVNFVGYLRGNVRVVTRSENSSKGDRPVPADSPAPEDWEPWRETAEDLPPEPISETDDPF